MRTRRAGPSLVLLVAACLIGLEITAAAPDPASSSASTWPSSEPAFFTGRTIVESGRTRIIPFRLAAAAEADRTWTASVGDASKLAIAREPAVISGHSIGYVRVEGLMTGETTLQIGPATMAIQVRPPLSVREHEPVIITPVTGAVVWGEFAVGVQVHDDPTDGRTLETSLMLPGGRALEPVRDTSPRGGPDRIVMFTVDGAELPAGPLDLLAVTIEGDRIVESRPVRCHILHVDGQNLIEGEAESEYDIDRPQRFRDDRRNIGRDKEASGGRYFTNASAYPSVCFPVDVQEAGWYQMMVRARGTFAGAAFPTVSIVLDGAPQPITNGRLVADRWHRIAVGVPVYLERGRRVLTPFFENDFYVARRADRNLYLDRVEVVRLDARPSGEVVAAVDDTLPVDPHGLAAQPLRVGFIRPYDGQPIPGDMEIEGYCWWTEPNERPAPVVTLLVNDRVVARQRSGAPRFWVDASQFRLGENTVQLVAESDSGVIERTPIQTMTYEAEGADGRDETRRRRCLRYSIHEPAWDDGARKSLINQRYPKERRAAGFYSAREGALRLPDDLAGRFNVFIELLGEHFQGAPVATIELAAGGERTVIGEVEAPTYWDTRSAGEVDLPPGPKQIIVSFRNDRFEQGKGDRNLLFQAVTLWEAWDGEDRTAPATRIDYPRDGQLCHMADAIVVDAWDDRGTRHAEVIFDDERTGIDMNLVRRTGRIVLPLILRDAEPGEHTVAVRVTDMAGNSSTTETRTINVPAEAPAELTTYQRAVRLLNRFGYGPDPNELAAVLAMGEEQWLADRLDQSYEDRGSVAAMGWGFSHFPQATTYMTPHRVLTHTILTPNPARARFVLWVENHFSTWVRKAEGPRKWQEHVAFSRHGAAPFGDLLRASAESPAMLRYLDQEQSFVGRLNENYAREIMELHTLGVDGGYTQQDVTNLAHLLTGWRATREGDGRSPGQIQHYEHRFDPSLNDRGETEVVGMDFPAVDALEAYDRVQEALEVLAAHPSTARFISRKLAEHYVGLPAPESLVNDLAVVFMETNGDMRQMLLSIARHEAFWNPNLAPRLAQPIDFAMRLCRTSGHVHPWAVAQYLQRSGTGLFDRPTPDGYPEEDESYADSNALLQRWRLAQEARWALAGLVPGQWRYTPNHQTDDWAQQIVDVLAVRLTGRVLGSASNEAAIELLKECTGDSNQRVVQIAPFIAQLPEANLR